MIDVRSVSKTYRGRGGARVNALDGVSLSCVPGRIHALLGPNGSGKTTLLRCIAGLLAVDQGTISLAGETMAQSSEKIRERMGFLTGTMKLPPRLTVTEILTFFGRLRGMCPRRLNDRVGEVIERLEMSGFTDRRMESLSMGQKQRAGIAQAILHEPDILVLDEVTVGLDVLMAREIIELVRETAENGASVLFSTHIMGEVTVLADSLTILHEGKAVFDGDLEALDRDKKVDNLEDEFIRRLKGGL